ncbi:unnamed protein product [Closterium sp. Yama58-4]|nr:unnamed protein product [Closterium sp. Yama58-4]
MHLVLPDRAPPVRAARLVKKIVRIFGGVKGFVTQPRTDVDPKTNARIYSDPETAKWLEEAQNEVDDPSAWVLGIIVYSDDTNATRNGRRQAWPFLLTLVNVPEELRKTEPGHALAGVLPFPPEWATSTEKARVFQEAIRIILAPLMRESSTAPLRVFYVTDAKGEPVKAVPCFFGYPGDFIEHCRATATLQTGTKRPCCNCYVPEELLRDLEHVATPRTVESEMHVLRNMLACKTLTAAEDIQTEWRKKTTKGETPSVILRLPGGSSYFMSGANYAAFEHRSMMQVMPILVADKSALRSGKEGELAALRVRAFRMYATFYKAFLGVSAHTEATLATARAHAIKLVEILPQAYPDHASHWRFPKIHLIVHLLDNVIWRGMPHHYSTEMWEHTHKGMVKNPVRGGNWKDISRRIVEEEVQREICREVAQDADGGRQYATALREAVEMMKPVLTRKGRTMRPAEEGDAVMGTYRTALGHLMDALPGSMVAASITASAVVAHTAVAIPRTKRGALVSKGAFVKASPKEKWFTDFAVKSPKKEEWYAKALCIFKAETAEGDRKGFVYVRWYERAGICPLTTCVQLTPSRKDTRHAVIAVESIERVAPPEKVFTFTEFPLIPTRVPLGTFIDWRAQLSREWHMPVCFMYNATGCVTKPPIVVLRRDDKRPVHAGRKKEHDVKVRYARKGRFSCEWHFGGRFISVMREAMTSVELPAQLFTEYMEEFNGELHAKNERAVVLVHNPLHTLTGCVKETSTVEGFVVEELTRVKAVFRTWFMRSAVTSTEWTRDGVFPRPPLHDVLYKLFMAGKLTMPGTIQWSWWRAGTVPKGRLSRMDRLKGKAAAGMFDMMVVDLTCLQLVIEEFKSKCSSGAFMTAWDFVGCDEFLLEKWAPEGAEEEGSEDEIPAFFCIPEGPLMRDSRSCRRVGRMVHGGFVKRAEALGIQPKDVPEEAGVVNEEVASRLRRTPTKRIRVCSSSDEGLTSSASDEGGHIPKAGVLFPLEDDKESVVRMV